MEKKGKKEKKPAEEVKKPENNAEKQGKILIIIFAAIILIVIAIAIFSQLSKKFEYNGVSFEKTRMGDIKFYTAKVPAIDSSGRVTSEIEIDFRSDPRKLEDIPSVDREDISFLDNRVYISTKSDISTCEGDTGIALINNGWFLKRFGLDVKGATDNESNANDTKNPYVNCETHPDNTVVLIKEGNETEIEKTAANCYEITFKDCEVISAVDKFDLLILEKYMSQFKEIA